MRPMRAAIAALGAGLALGAAAAPALASAPVSASAPLPASGAAAHWVPPAHPTWYWQLQGTVRTEPVQISDVDGFETTRASVARLHAAGQHVVCYVDAGTWERFRPDAGRFPPSVLGRANGWPGERWLDIRRLRVLEPLMLRRLLMCAGKGFDAVEADNIDGYANATGFAITPADQLRYDEWLAGAAHRLGLAALQKNDPGQARTLEPHFDGVLDEQCNQYAECGAFASYLAAGKPVLDAEYRSVPGFCAADRRRGIMGARFALGLDGSRYAPCR